MGGGGWEYLINLPLPDSDRGSGDKIPFPNVYKVPFLVILTCLLQVQLCNSLFIVLRESLVVHVDLKSKL